MRTTSDHSMVAHHPSVGDLHVGEFVSISSGNPSNPYLARIAGRKDDSSSMLIQWCWRPTELLEYMAKTGHVIPDGRAAKSFAQNEVVLGTRTEAIAVNSVLGRAEVFLISEISEGKHQFDSWFFYRQVVVDDGTQWRLEPPLNPSVVDLTDSIHSRLVENPGKILRYCSARLSFACDPELLYDIGDERLKEVWEPNEAFTCPSCAEEEAGLEIASKDKTMLGVEWLKSVDLAAIEAPIDDSKRLSVIEKFCAAVDQPEEYENVESVVISSGDLLRLFCIELEREIHESTMGKPRDYKSRIYTLSFNLNDKRNTSIRRRIIEGEFSPLSLASADSETLASEDVKISRQEQRDKYFTTQVLKPKEDEGAELKKQRLAMGEVNIHSLNAIDHLNEPTGPLPPASQYETHDETMEESAPVMVAATISIREETVDIPVAHAGEVPQETHRSQQEVKWESARKRLGEVADRIKRQLKQLDYEAQRDASIALVEYIMRHV